MYYKLANISELLRNMPKVKTTQAEKLSQYVRQFPTFKTDGKILFCKVCNKSVTADKMFTIKQHLSTTRHLELANKNNLTNITQTLIGECSTSQDKNVQFAEDLCSALVSADIPLYKIRNKNIISFLEKYTEYKVPSETTLRNKHLRNLYTSTLDHIKTCIKNRYLWISIDETTDATGRYVANVIIGILDSDDLLAKQKFLLNTALLEKANHNTIARLFEDSIKILGESFNRDMILLFITDAAPYMVKAAKAIQTFYPKITHLTCLAHGLHRVCEQIRGIYGNVDRLIANVKKVFLKAPSRVAIFKDIAPQVALPPQPITTRWGTWIEAVCYYANNLEMIRNVLDALDEDDAMSIKISKNLVNDETIKMDLIFISSNYGFLNKSIKKLETSGLSLSAQVDVIMHVETTINSIGNSAADSVKKKLSTVISKNNGFSLLKYISECLTGEANEVNTSTYTTSEIMAFKFAPITSVDVERSFSMYKNVLRANRQSFLFENLAEIFVIYCNKKI